MTNIIQHEYKIVVWGNKPQDHVSFVTIDIVILPFYDKKRNQFVVTLGLYLKWQTKKKRRTDAM